jgi:hypothetical protein
VANGCTRAGRRYIDQAALIAANLKDERRQIWNLVNRLLIQRSLNGHANTSTLEGIRLWAVKRGDTNLEEHLDFALGINIKESVNEFCSGEIE